MLDAGYSPHEGVPGRRCALCAGRGVSGVSGRAPSVLIRRQSGVTGKTRQSPTGLLPMPNVVF